MTQRLLLLRLLLLSAFLLPAAGWAQGWLIAVDVPATADSQMVSPGQVIQVDDADPTPSVIATGLPEGVSLSALARHPDESICWTPAIPVDLPDGQHARPEDVICFEDGSYTRVFRASDFGLEHGVLIRALAWDQEETMFVGLSLPVSISGSFVGPGELIVVDGSSLFPFSGSPELGARTTIKAGTWVDENELALAVEGPLEISGGIASGLVLARFSTAGGTVDSVIADLFDDPTRSQLAGLHRLMPSELVDLLFSDRFETP